jgi:hypothetical protein
MNMRSTGQLETFVLIYAAKMIQYVFLTVLGEARVARLFLVQHTNMGKSIPNNHKIYQMATK